MKHLYTNFEPKTPSKESKGMGGEAQTNPG